MGGRFGRKGRVDRLGRLGHGRDTVKTFTVWDIRRPAAILEIVAENHYKARQAFFVGAQFPTAMHLIRSQIKFDARLRDNEESQWERMAMEGDSGPSQPSYD